MSKDAFPSLSSDAFSHGCRQLAARFDRYGHLQDAWHSVKLTTDEALPCQPSSPQARVEYSIYSSPSYRVPVLYIGIQDYDGGATTSIDRMGELLIPPQFKSQIEKVGIIGAVSMTNHPVTDMAVFFVHPCNTADALEAAASTLNPSPLEYLQLWFGIVGACVGLDFPLALTSQGGSH
ncbi:uncharacterized protein IWZ02DRAFT_494595 [Phyllosticta citriasiana]|uniref:uncharacterized protein n=1 Tax=Phyllosticta citriasiana TaxID=595635 RepID=UPI0030FD612C